MNFNTEIFALFCLVVGALFAVTQWGFRSYKPQNAVLLAASFFFYGWWDHRFLFLLILSSGLDFVCGIGMTGRPYTRGKFLTILATLLGSAFLLCAPIDWKGIASVVRPAIAWRQGWAPSPCYEGVFRAGASWLDFFGAAGSSLACLAATGIGFFRAPEKRRKHFLWVSMVGNLVLLGFFKYFDFFVVSLHDALSVLGVQMQDWRLGIIVPVGISFYTFQTMSYTIDVYRGDMDATDDLLDFLLFVSFFPQLVAGPIERGSVLLPQLQRRRTLDWNGIQTGAWLIGWGLCKKILIADNLARIVNDVYEVHYFREGPPIWIGAWAFVMQVYADFSAYSDIARGLSRMMGVELMVNFNVPYSATNPAVFWQRWHISLSSWLRDYLFIPLGGSRGSGLLIYRNLMLTMTLGGLWHGARANFVWWGVFHGVLLCGHRFLQPWLKRMEPKGPITFRLWKLFCWFTFMSLFTYGLLIFRCKSMAMIGDYTVALFHGWGEAGRFAGMAAKLVWFSWPLCVMDVVQFRSRNLLQPLCWPAPVRVAVYVGIFYLTVLFGSFDVVDFIYFQF